LICSDGKCLDSGISTSLFKPDSSWSNGYCGTFTVTNGSKNPTKGWTVLVDLKGAVISSSWSTARTATSTGMQFANATYNAVIASKSTMSFGFCTTFTGTMVPPTVVTSKGTY
jgi:cellulase/cellobiase CelA1